ncbi:methyltransferase domain-containing protein [Roseivirga sp. BDSF3-8]|uniref:methyltransferase domain-containing protein n=1 Tax=Roseivirga sp. BDSF3-8 TaxID=3241598 RepID=UPI00353196C5
MSNRFSQRSYEREIMDDLDSGGQEMAVTLRELEVINRNLGGNAVSISGLNKLVKGKAPGRLLHIADIGCGGGDMLVKMARWGRSKGIKLQLTGVDANPHIISMAEENTSEYPEIDYRVIDIFSEEYRQSRFDIVNCSLFTHHFTNEELTQMFRTMYEQSALGFIINDLHRHWFAYHSIKILTRLFSNSPMVQNDAPLSVLRAFSRSDLETLMNASGIHSYDLGWYWAFRWQLIARH